MKVRIKETGEILKVTHFGYTVWTKDGWMCNYDESECEVIEQKIKPCPNCGEKVGTYSLGKACCACHEEFNNKCNKGAK
jgi:hypothetical protein